MITLQAIRKSKGYTLHDAAEHCSTSETEMTEVEDDPGNMPASMAIKLRKLYGIPIDYYL